MAYEFSSDELHGTVLACEGDQAPERGVSPSGDVERAGL